MATYYTKYFSKKLNEYFNGKIKFSYVSAKSVIIITENDKVYRFYRNSNSEFIIDKLSINTLIKNSVIALSENESIVNSLIEESIVKELFDKNVINIKNSISFYYHGIALTSDGKIFCWGNNNFGQLGNGKQDNNLHEPELNEFLINEKIIDICVGSDHSLALTENGDVYVWGLNSFGQSGKICENNDKSHIDSQLIPNKIRFNGDKIKSISCGLNHSLALTEGGHVYGWGWNNMGQLGFDCRLFKILNEPKLIEIDVKCHKISCGQCHSLILSVSGDIYIFGANRRRQLGNPEFKGLCCEKPFKLTEKKEFINIVCDSQCHISVAQTKNNEYYVWGVNRITEPTKQKETDFKSLNNIFAHYLGITNEMIKGPIIEFHDDFLRHKFYDEKFDQKEKLGKGSYGIVFKVIDKNSDKIFAVKKIKFQNFTEKVLKELETTSFILKLDGQNILNYYDVWLENDSNQNSIGLNTLMLYIHMELCSKTLSDLIEQIQDDSNLKETDSLTLSGYFIASLLFYEILEGVQHLHKQNPPIIHRDLKPDNILLTNGLNGKFVKIADFGLVATHKYFLKQEDKRTENNEPSHTSSVGTADYAAPEALDGRIYNTKADIYSLGVILKELFFIDTKRDYLQSEINSSLLMPKYNYLKDMCERMKNEHDPNERPNCEEILNDQHNWSLHITDFDSVNKFKMILNQLIIS